MTSSGYRTLEEIIADHRHVLFEERNYTAHDGIHNIIRCAIKKCEYMEVEVVKIE